MRHSSPSYARRSRFVSLFLVSAVAGSLLTLPACGTSAAQSAGAAPAPPQVSVAEVVQREVTDFEDFTGRVEAIERVELRPRVSGYIDSVRFHEGAEVHRGDLLFLIDDRSYEATLKRAQAELARAQSARRQAQSERERAEKLLTLHALSQEEYDARTSGNEQADAQVQAAQAAVDTAALELGFTQVRAPIDGVVGRAEVTAGNFVTSGGTRLTTLVSVDPVYVRFQGDETAYLRYAGEAKADAGRKAGRAGAVAAAPVWIGLADEDGHPHAGELVFVDNELDPATGTINARARLRNPDRRFTPGMFARVRLGSRATHAAVLITDAAVGTDQNRRFVFVVTGQNTAEYREVDLGSLDGGLRVVRSGLQPGERVVVNGLQRVRPGSAVTPERVAMETTSATGDAKALLAGNKR